jgi:hypothetical protein
MWLGLAAEGRAFEGSDEGTGRHLGAATTLPAFPGRQRASVQIESRRVLSYAPVRIAWSGNGVAGVTATAGVWPAQE